jgi:hypothetical protein
MQLEQYVAQMIEDDLQIEFAISHELLNRHVIGAQ